MSGCKVSQMQMPRFSSDQPIAKQQSNGTVYG